MNNKKQTKWSRLGNMLLWIFIFGSLGANVVYCLVMAILTIIY